MSNDKEQLQDFLKDTIKENRRYANNFLFKGIIKILLIVPLIYIYLTHDMGIIIFGNITNRFTLSLILLGIIGYLVWACNDFRYAIHEKQRLPYIKKELERRSEK